MKIEIYTRPDCGFCHRAKALLDRKKADYHEIDISKHPEERDVMIERSQRTTVPQIFFDGKSIGGCDDLYDLEYQGQLNKILGID